MAVDQGKMKDKSKIVYNQLILWRPFGPFSLRTRGTAGRREQIKSLFAVFSHLASILMDISVARKTRVGL